MNFKTTVALIVLVGLLAALFVFGPGLGPRLGVVPPASVASDQGSLAVLQTDLTPTNLTRIEILSGDRKVVLQRGPGGDWVLPGNWPTRKAEIEQFFNALSTLKTRFRPMQVTDVGDFEKKGLTKPELTLVLHAGNTEHRLALGEEPGEKNRFTKPTWLRVDDKMEVVRVAPGVIAALNQPEEHFLQRRLFVGERVAQEGNPQQKVERLTARAITAKGPSNSYELEQVDGDWHIKEPTKDRVDPERLRQLLTTIPDIWAEQFVSGKDLAAYGLDKPTEVLTVTGAKGEAITLLIGKTARTKARTVTRPAPNMPGMPPMGPQKETIHEEYRYAKLQNNDQVFEIQAARLKDIYLPVSQLRDSRVVRLRNEDVKRLEIKHGDVDVVLVRDDKRWKVEKPYQAEADDSKITELLDRLSGLSAQDKDVLDKANPKAQGLDSPRATVRITTEVEKGEGKDKTKVEKTTTLLFGKDEGGKTFVQVQGFPRVNAVEDAATKLVQRPALAYRGRRVLDVGAGDLARIEVEGVGAPYAFAPEAKGWQLVSPVRTEVDSAKMNRLTDDLTRLEAVEYIATDAPEADLESKYGLAKPPVTVRLKFKDEKKPVRTLVLGKQREGKPEYYARLSDGPGIFTVRQDTYEALAQDSLAYRPLQLWQVAPDRVKEVALRQNEEPEYALVKAGTGWQLKGPFDAPAVPEIAAALAAEVENLRAERFVAHDSKEAAKYGLDKPTLRIVLQETATAKEEGGKGSAHVLLLGKPEEKPSGGRFGKLAESEAIFVLSPKSVAALDRGPLEFLNRSLLSVRPDQILSLDRESSEGGFKLHRVGQEWKLAEGSTPAFPVDQPAVASTLHALATLRAARFVAYGPKVDRAKYGLDKPANRLVFTIQGEGAADKSKPVEHTLFFGNAVEGETGTRYAQLDKQPGVVVLDAATTKSLDRGQADYVDRTLLRFAAQDVLEIQRRIADQTLALAKRDDRWQVTQPFSAPADEASINDLLARLSNLRAERVVAYQPKDLASFGLQEPAAILGLKVGGNEPSDIRLRIGKPVADGNEARFAQVDKSPIVGVLPADLTKSLLRSPLQLRERTLAQVEGVDRITQERGGRKAVFARVNGTWKQVEPVQGEAEAVELDVLLRLLAPFRPEEIVAEKPANLKQYGLERPLVRWRFQAGDKEVLQLLVGDPEKVNGKGGKLQEGPRSYAQIAGSNFVVLLDPRLSVAATAEYRERAVWPPFDPANVDRLTISAGSESFKLERTEGSWRVAGMDDRKVNPNAVNDTLTALAGLRAARYAEDKDADPRLFGLDNPRRKIEVELRSEKRILELGNPESGSRRVYGRVGRPDRTDVFILSEGDTERLIRSLDAFAKGP